MSLVNYYGIWFLVDFVRFIILASFSYTIQLFPSKQFIFSFLQLNFCFLYLRPDFKGWDYCGSDSSLINPFFCSCRNRFWLQQSYHFTCTHNSFIYPLIIWFLISSIFVEYWSQTLFYFNCFCWQKSHFLPFFYFYIILLLICIFPISIFSAYWGLTCRPK